MILYGLFIHKSRVKTGLNLWINYKGNENEKIKILECPSYGKYYAPGFGGA